MGQFGEFMKDLLYAVLLVLVPLLGTYLGRFIHSKKIALDLDTGVVESELLRNEALDLIQSVVDMLAQTYVEDLKSAGEFTLEHQKEALARAVDRVVELTSDDVQEFVIRSYNDLRGWIETQVEAYIRSQKALEG